MAVSHPGGDLGTGAAAAIVVAIAIVVLVVRGLGLRLGLPVVILGHVLVTQPFVILIVMARLASFGTASVEAARDPLPDEDPAEGRHRDGTFRARLQSDAVMNIVGVKSLIAAIGALQALSRQSVADCTAQMPSQWLSDANGVCSPRKSPKCR